MYIEFDKLVVKNFMSIGNSPVEWDIKSYKKVLIQGKNYSGKTTLFQALTFALFGRAYAKIVKKDLVNDINERGCEVELFFTIGNDKYNIIRKIKPDDFKIFKNGVKVEVGDISKIDQQEYLEKHIIKMDFRAFTQIVMLSTAGYKPFIELSSPERRKFIESFLNIEFFSVMNGIVKKDADQCNKVVESITNEIVSYDRHIKLLEEFIEQADNRDGTAELQSLIEDIKNKVTSYKDMEKSLDVLNQLKSKVSYDYVRHNEVIELINSTKSDIMYTTKSQENTRDAIAFFDNTPVCPECNQPVDPEHKQKHLDKYNTVLYNNNEKISELKANLDKLNIELQTISKEGSKITEIDNKYKVIESKMSWMKSELTTLYKKKLALENAPKDTIKDEKILELQSAKAKRLELNSTLTTERTNKKYYDAILATLKDSGAKTEIINKYVPVICGFVNKTLDKLNMYLKFELDGEFNEKLKSRHRAERQYESFSLGERMRLNIALLWAWREVAKIRTGISTNLLAFDEVLENLDVDGFEELLTLVAEDTKLNCVVISHKLGVETLFDKVLSVKKVKGFTQINFE